MNILIVTQLYPQPDDIGDNKPTKTVEYFAKEWVMEGHRVVVIHCPSKFPLVYYLIPSMIKNKFAGKLSFIVPPIESREFLQRDEYGIKVYRLPMFKLFPGSGYSSQKMLNQTNTIAKLLEELSFEPDIVMGHFANPSTELVANLAKYYKIKSSIVFHNDCNKRSIKKYKLESLVNNIGAIGARSKIEAEELKRLLKLERNPFICYSGVPNDAIESAEKICVKHDYSNGIKYIYVGSLIKRKNVDAVIKGFVNQSKENDTLKIIGGGPEEDNLKLLTSKLNAEHRVIFTGRVTREEVLNQMKEAQVFTLVSDAETFGMVYIEAMLQGCLTIASRGGGFDGLIKDGQNGFICNPGDDQMLKSIYRRIEGMTEQQRNTIGQNAIDTAVNFSEKLVAKRYLNKVLKMQT